MQAIQPEISSKGKAREEGMSSQQCRSLLQIFHLNLHLRRKGPYEFPETLVGHGFGPDDIGVYHK
jgi:hypothetical protein